MDLTVRGVKTQAARSDAGSVSDRHQPGGADLPRRDADVDCFFRPVGLPRAAGSSCDERSSTHEQSLRHRRETVEAARNAAVVELDDAKGKGEENSKAIPIGLEVHELLSR